MEKIFAMYEGNDPQVDSKKTATIVWPDGGAHERSYFETAKRLPKFVGTLKECQEYADKEGMVAPHFYETDGVRGYYGGEDSFGAIYAEDLAGKFKGLRYRIAGGNCKTFNEVCDRAAFFAKYGALEQLSEVLNSSDALQRVINESPTDKLVIGYALKKQYAL